MYDAMIFQGKRSDKNNLLAQNAYHKMHIYVLVSFIAKITILFWAFLFQRWLVIIGICVYIMHTTCAMNSFFLL